MSKIIIGGIIILNLFLFIKCMDLSPPRIRTATCRHFKTKEDCLLPRIVGIKSSGSWCQWRTSFGYENCEYDPESIENHFCLPKTKSDCKGPYCYFSELGSCKSAPLNCLSRITQGSCEKTLAYNGSYCHWYNTGATQDNLGFALCGVKN